MTSSKTGPEFIKHISCSTQQRMKFILLKNVRIVGIFTFISRANITTESFKAPKNCYFSVFILILRAVEICCLVEMSIKEVL